MKRNILKTKNITPKSYRDTFEQLKHFNLFEKKILQQLANTTGFRNRLAREYDDLDQEITIESIKQLPKLYKHYLKTIMEFIENHNN